MDILQPEFYWINNICYRVNPSSAEGLQGLLNNQSTDIPARYDFEKEELCDDEAELEVTCLDDGRFRYEFPIAGEFYSHIIGAKGNTRKRLETDCGVQIRVPKQGQTGNIVVTGSKRANVAAAYNQISVLVGNVRRKQPFTHFLSIAIKSNSIREKFAEFLEGIRPLRVDEKLFQIPEKLHLTLGTLVLMDERERTEAARILRDMGKDDLFSKSLEIVIEGVEIMNDDPSSVDVLYARVKETASAKRLQDMAMTLMDCFVKAGLAYREFERLKLHVTLLNASFRDDECAPKVSFDARPIIEKFANFHFGRENVDTVHLSQRCSTGPDGYYKSTAKLSLTSS